jgi:hypothetical protein
MKKLIIITMLIAMFAILPAEQHQQTSDVVIETFSWEEGYKNVYLHAGTYSFEFECTVTTDNPYDDSNTWINSAIVKPNIYNYAQYGCANYAVTEHPFYDSSNTFSIQQTGTYSIRAGSYAIWGCTVNSNTATLIRHQLNNND